MFLAAAALASTLVIQLPWMNAPTAGTVYDSADHPGAIFVVEGFQLRCGPCNENAPRFAAMARSYGNEPRAQFVEVGLDRTARDFQQWIARHQPSHPVLMDAERAVWGPLGGTGTPTTWVLDCHMNVVWEHVGGLGDEGEVELKAAVDSALTLPCE